jgi:DNA replication licensing factor MCM3
MEQGRVTISKAGIHASLNARCSVLAAANPVYGRYDQYKTPMENIGLQDSLLSRFDLLFVMLDTIDSDQDHRISDHVVRMHRYRNPKEQDGEVLAWGDNSVDMLTTFNPESEEKETPVFEKYDPLLHGSSRKSTDQILSMEFMKKYISVVKCMKPKLSEQACELISNEYSRLRSQDMMDSDVARTQPVTARSLETLIRLSTAHAKARMAKAVQAQDAQAAIELIQYAYFKKVLEKEKKRKRREGEEDGESEDEDEEMPTQGTQSTRRTKRTRRATYETDEDDEVLPEATPEDSGDLTKRKSIAASRDSEPSTSGMSAGTAGSSGRQRQEISEDRLKIFKNGLQKAFRESREQSMSLENVVKYINQHSGDEQFTEDEIASAVHKMTDDNQIMVADGIVFLI